MISAHAIETARRSVTHHRTAAVHAVSRHRADMPTHRTRLPLSPNGPSRGQRSVGRYRRTVRPCVDRAREGRSVFGCEQPPEAHTFEFVLAAFAECDTG